MDDDVSQSSVFLFLAGKLVLCAACFFFQQIREKRKKIEECVNNVLEFGGSEKEI